jgi:predicted O-linked N-acetylglucosamine transferase (SPINDLY family)
VDLNGYIKRARPWILASHPAPIQVSFLGFPGTMASAHIDYLVADDFVIPESEAKFYQEAVVYLPGCYQVNDRRRPLPDTTQPRQRFGLPSSGVVFCAFNNSWKITQPVFVTWMQILRQVEGSVLWLLDDNPWATGNLRNAARLLGVSPERLVFASRVNQAEHLARHGAADLFLDTLPCNGHTTASDALWSGLPVIARTGRSFASRVAGSLLRAVGLPELIAASATEYIATAVALASDPPKLAQMREKLLLARGQSVLFDSLRFRQHLEQAYGRMVNSYTSGAKHAGFYISPDAPGPTSAGAVH